MIECPDCGKFFKSSKCSCGYTPGANNSANSEQALAEFLARKHAGDIEHRKRMTIDEQKKAVCSTVKVTGFRRWAYEIIALRDAGFYTDLHGIQMAEKVIGMDKEFSHAAM